MQIISSPSREDIDKAHMFLRSLDIGIPSFKNMGLVSHFKRTCWSVLLLSSLPIHLFFNSTIFETQFQGSNWHVTIATKAFTQGADFFPPGASLAPAGSTHPAYYLSNESSHGNWPTGFGGMVPLEQFSDKMSEPMQDISKAATNGRNWDNLDPNTCLTEYSSCKPRNQHRDVVIVVEKGINNNTRGWSRIEVFNLTYDLSLQWDKYVPPNRVNSLWYSTQCNITRAERYDEEDCNNNCREIFPTNNMTKDINGSMSSDWMISLHQGVELSPVVKATFGFNEKFDNLSVKHCLAEPYPRVCKVGLSNMLLLVVIICTFTKVIQCAVILWKLPEYTIVTPGDAIASFITKPDAHTSGLGSLDILDSHRLNNQLRRFWSSDEVSSLTETTKPRQWFDLERRYISAIPRAVWIRTYILLLLPSMGLLSAGLALSYEANNISFQGPFGQSDTNRRSGGMDEAGYLLVIIAANGPQLLLSICYFSYNAFFTRLQVEREWNSYSLGYQPLRVSHPRGQQVSSYRLQLPYKYSIPLIATSVACHWLLSNALFLYIIEGGFWGRSYAASTKAYFRVSENSLAAFGYSPPAMLSIFIVCCVLVPLPLLFSLRKPKGKMVIGGSDSLVVSAACHCLISSSTEAQSQTSPPLNDEVAVNAQDLEDDTTRLATDDFDDREEEMLRELSQSELKWGATSLPSDLAEAMNEESGNVVMHLGFGGESSNVRCPEEGEWYV
ncbi:hypothetical protein F4815DRAFT_462719 [Daldinia loculata]|nr:hypothetical protein F4815DRAFT_462719 [Daldinia loculata]